MSFKEKLFSYCFCLLFLVMTFSPETYGVSFKYAVIPLFFSLYFIIRCKTYHFFINKLQLLVITFALILFCSTITSQVVESEPKLRSTIIFIFIYMILSCYNPKSEQISIIKHMYVFSSFIIGLWIIYSVFRYGLFGLDRYNFQLFYFKKDVNYLLAFLMPSAYLSARDLVFGTLRIRGKIINLLNIVFASVGILSLQSRSALLTFIICAFFLFLEYNRSTKISLTKIFAIFVLLFIALMAFTYIINNDSFSRLTDSSGYEDNIRLIVWEHSLQAFYQNPIFGSGLGASSHFSEQFTGFQSHNNYIDILGDCGLIGFIIFSFIILDLQMVPKSKKMNMFSYTFANLFPLFFINGFQTISFWLPMYLLILEKKWILTNNQTVRVEK